MKINGHTYPLILVSHHDANATFFRLLWYLLGKTRSARSPTRIHILPTLTVPVTHL